MLQSKKELLKGTIARNNLFGAVNLALRYAEQKRKPLHPHYTPTALQVEITTACNLKCEMCEHSFMRENPGNFSLESFKKLVDENPNVQVLNITGIGESLLHPDFLEMVEYAKEKGMYVWFTDNFTLWNEKSVSRLLDSKADFVVLSLDGATKEVYEKIRRGAQWEKVLQNLKLLKRERDSRKSPTPKLGVNFCILNENFFQVEKMVKLCNELGVDVLMYSTPLFSDHTGKLSLGKVDAEKLKTLTEKAQRTAAELGVRVLIWPDTSTAISTTTGCDYPWQNPYISYNGDVLPCCFIPQIPNARASAENVMGNVLQEKLEKIWNGGKFAEFRKKIKTSNPPTPCKTCPKFYGH
ncbi:MAG: radical SAM protein [Candidatus Diapherotrites archaeon]